MFNLFSKKHLLTLTTLLAFSSPVIAEDCCCETNRFYIGGFGGGIYSNSSRVSQEGTAFFLEAQGGPLAVNARGNTHKKSSGFYGGQIGFEWTQCPRYFGCSNFNVTPALELEGFFYRQTKKGHLMNPTNRLEEHDFAVTLPTDTAGFLVNGVLSLNHSCFGRFSPYIGGGIGAAYRDVRRAKSIQVAPPERGVNHFNAKTRDSAWAFAAQAKAGLRFNFCERFHIFGEYRFLFVNNSNFNFGSTVYPNHAVTSPWLVQMKNTYYNAFAVGLQFDL